jgi:carbonic anhydrase
MGLNQGELFVHRNIANLVPNSDLNVLSVIYYAVMELKVEDIFVLGHYGCGGVKAASDNKDHGLIEHWLRNIRDVQRIHNTELQQITDPNMRHRRLVELNVQEQCINLFGNSIVQQAQSATSRPRIHGMTYDIQNGYLKYLDVDFKRELKKYRRIYTVADFDRYKPVDLGEYLEKKVVPEGAEEQSLFSSPLLPDDVEGGEELYDHDDAGSVRGALTGEESREVFDSLDETGKGWISITDLEKAVKQHMVGGGDSNDENDVDDVVKGLLEGVEIDKIDFRTFDSLLAKMCKEEKEMSTAKVDLQKEDELLFVVKNDNKSLKSIKCIKTDSVAALKLAISKLAGLDLDQFTLRFKGKKICGGKEGMMLGEIKGMENAVGEVEVRTEIVPGNFRR